mmetsp:Transcript_27616/g.73636  ORF Transcript_27616/g.73636 Transcript_27616/m.73636 type:complete len:270 (-) Transcript_27616:379-1188(-)
MGESSSDPRRYSRKVGAFLTSSPTAQSQVALFWFTVIVTNRTSENFSASLTYFCVNVRHTRQKENVSSATISGPKPLGISDSGLRTSSASASCDTTDSTGVRRMRLSHHPQNSSNVITSSSSSSAKTSLASSVRPRPCSPFSSSDGSSPPLPSSSSASNTARSCVAPRRSTQSVPLSTRRMAARAWTTLSSSIADSAAPLTTASSGWLLPTSVKPWAWAAAPVDSISGKNSSGSSRSERVAAAPVGSSTTRSGFASSTRAVMYLSAEST